MNHYFTHSGLGTVSLTGLRELLTHRLQLVLFGVVPSVQPHTNPTLRMHLFLSPSSSSS